MNEFLPLDRLWGVCKTWLAGWSIKNERLIKEYLATHPK
jgi:hypothetical protein